MKKKTPELLVSPKTAKLLEEARTVSNSIKEMSSILKELNKRMKKETGVKHSVDAQNARSATDSINMLAARILIVKAKLATSYQKDLKRLREAYNYNKVHNDE